MKIMRTNHISDKCIFPYVNKRTLALEDVRPQLSPEHDRPLLVLGVCFVSPWKWPFPTELSHYKNVYKAYHVSSQCPNMKIHFKQVVFVREKFTYIHQSESVLGFLSSPQSINNLHKTCTYLQQAGAC